MMESTETAGRMADVNVRYIVDDVAKAIEFYTTHFGFEVEMHPGPSFAALRRGEFRLVVNLPGGGGGAGQALPDGRIPQPGGWNRIQLVVDDLDRRADALERGGVRSPSGIIEGRGGRQLLLDDPAGNLVELFEPGG
jgi:catechol 2,3-dioxygenase-like lactoylglutathione lyase family enzyme